MILVDMIGDRDLAIRRDANSTPWLTNIIWDAARQKELDDYFIDDTTKVEDDHLPFAAAGVPSVDIIDLDYDAWHTAKDTLDACSARSLQVVGDVVLAALPQIETHLGKGLTLTGRRLKTPRRYVTVNARRRLKPRERLREKRHSSLDLAAH
jgi:hypothetical protein